MKITYYERHHTLGAYSIERVFRDVRSALPKSVNYKVTVCRFESRGLWRRLFNTLEAIFMQGEINHITGDVHYLAYLLRKRKTLLTIHDCSHLERLKGIKKWLYFLLWYWLPEKRSALVSVISKSTRKELLRYLGCSPDKIRVVPDCVSPEFQPHPRVFNSLKPNILQIGTRYNKNVLRVAEALKGIACHLMVIGELSKEQRDLLHKYNIEHSAVANISNDELVEMYKLCDLVLFVSTNEGFGLPILEANAIGRPVVTSSILSMPEVAGDAACLVDPFEVKDIKGGILRVIQDAQYREELISNGYRNVLRFRAEIIAAQYVELYMELLNKN